MGVENDDDANLLDEEVLQKVRKAYDFSIGVNSAKQVAEALPQLDLFEALRPVREALQEQTVLFEALGSQLKQAAGQIGNAWLPLTEEMASKLAEPFRLYAEGVGKALEGISIAGLDDEHLLAPVNRLAMEYGWPPLYYLTPRAIQDLFKKAEELIDESERQAYIDGQIVGYYRENLDSLLAAWERQPILEATERLAIISDGLEAHRAGKYSLSSPAILAQIEGLFVDHLESGGSKYIKHVQHQHYKNQLKKLRSKQGAKGLVYGLAEALYSFVVEHGLYGTNSPRNPISDISIDVSRHSILHGRSTVYCKREDISLRHLLWLDCVIELINSLNPQGLNG